MKHRLTKDQRAKVRGTLAQYLVRMGLDEDTAVRAVTNGSPCMADAVGRRIANGPGYSQLREVTPDMFNLAVAEWIAYKCGIRDEAAPAPAEEDEATESGDAEPEPEAAPPATPREALERNGATNIEEYSLVNNYGFTFDLDGKKYDARFWANCYGTALNRWEVMSRNKREDDPRFVYPVDPELKARLEDALNATHAA